MDTLRMALGSGAAGKDVGKEVVLDGVRLAYDDEGAGPLLVCLHSIAHGARDFETLRQRLRGAYRVVALDWPGHGRSAPDRFPADAGRYAELLERFLDALGEPAVLLGNSIGGAAAIRVAARRPDRVRALVLVDTGGLSPRNVVTRSFTAVMAAFFRAGARGARWFPRAYAFYYARVLQEPAAAEQRRRVVAAGREMAPRLAEAWSSFGRASADVRKEAWALACPVLVAWAERDVVIPLRLHRAAIARIPDATLEVFPGGHAPFLESPDRFFPSLERFLARVAPSRAAADRAPAAVAG